MIQAIGVVFSVTPIHNEAVVRDARLQTTGLFEV